MPGGSKRHKAAQDARRRSSGQLRVGGGRVERVPLPRPSPGGFYTRVYPSSVARPPFHPEETHWASSGRLGADWGRAIPEAQAPVVSAGQQPRGADTTTQSSPGVRRRRPRGTMTNASGYLGHLPPRVTSCPKTSPHLNIQNPTPFQNPTREACLAPTKIFSPPARAPI